MNGRHAVLVWGGSDIMMAAVKRERPNHQNHHALPLLLLMIIEMAKSKNQMEKTYQNIILLIAKVENPFGARWGKKVNE